MRIIAGKYKGHKIDRVNSPLTRESQDKVRGAIFNSIVNDINGSNVLDLFAGSGSYGLEALSRGANKTTFIDREKIAINTIRNNLEKLKISRDEYQLIQGDYKLGLNKLIKDGVRFNIVIIDPPYKYILNSSDYELLDLVTDDEGLLIYELDKKSEEVEVYGRFQLVKSKVYGSKKVLYYKKY